MNATGPEMQAPTPRRAAGGWLYLAVFTLFAVLYAATCQRGAAWQDSGLYQWRILNLDLVGHMGLALSHPLLILLGKAFSHLPLGPLAWRVNLLSGACGALATANIALLVRRLVPDRPTAAWLGAGVFGLAHAAWWLATLCESQAVLAALFTTQLVVLAGLIREPRHHRALLLGALSGLAFTVHGLALLALPVYGLVVLALWRRRELGAGAVVLLAAGWIVGAAGMLVMIYHAAWQVGLPAAVGSALFGSRWRADVLGGSARALTMGAAAVLYSLPNAALPLAAAGLVVLRDRHGRMLPRALAALAAIYLLFAIRYPVPDQFMFFLPFYATAAVLAGAGLARLPASGRWGWLTSAALVSLLVGPVLYAAAPVVWPRLGLPLPGRRDLPFRDPARYWLSPWKAGENSAALFARAALGQAPPDAVIIADGTSLYPLLWTQRLYPPAKPVRVVADIRARDLPVGTPNVFVVSPLAGYHPPWLDQVAEFRKDSPAAVLHRVIWRPAATTQPSSAR